MGEAKTHLLTRTQWLSLTDLTAYFEMEVPDLRRLFQDNELEIVVGSSGIEMVLTSKRVRRLWAQRRLPQLDEKINELRRRKEELDARLAVEVPQQHVPAAKPSPTYPVAQLLLWDHVAEIEELLRHVRIPPRTTAQQWIQREIEAELIHHSMDLDHWVFLLRRWQSDPHTRKQSRKIGDSIRNRIVAACAASTESTLTHRNEPTSRIAIRKRAVSGAQIARSGQTRKQGSHRSQR